MDIEMAREVAQIDIVVWIIIMSIITISSLLLVQVIRNSQAGIKVVLIFSMIFSIRGLVIAGVLIRIYQFFSLETGQLILFLDLVAMSTAIINTCIVGYIYSIKNEPEISLAVYAVNLIFIYHALGAVIGISALGITQ